MDKIMIVMGLTLVSFSLFMGYESNEFRKMCNDAGGVYATATVCVNPSAIIEVK